MLQMLQMRLLVMAHLQWRRERWKLVLNSVSPLFILNSDPSLILPFSVAPLWKDPQTQRCVSLVILSPIKLTMKTDHLTPVSPALKSKCFCWDVKPRVMDSWTVELEDTCVSHAMMTCVSQRSLWDSIWGVCKYNKWIWTLDFFLFFNKLYF